MAKFWRTARREIDFRAKTLVMGILNVTPDSFSDGGKFAQIDSALRRAETMIAEGADILDIGGESTRPNAQRVAEDEEIKRVVPIIAEISRRFNVPISIDTTKSEVANRAVAAGAEIINDISGLRFDAEIGRVAARTNAGLILMHLRGDFETMHHQKPVEHILPEVLAGLRLSVEKALDFGVAPNQIALDIGIGFSKTLAQNLELLARSDEICRSLNDFPILVGTSRKSFIAKLLARHTGESAPSERLFGSIASASVAISKGANIIRVHDVRASVEAARIVEAIISG